MEDRSFRELVERVKLRSPVEVVVQERVPSLTKRGALWQACCPFHEEKTPSFKVNPQRGTWYCFGACKEGGDVLSFVQRFDGLSFLDALKLLAQAAGEDVPDTFRRRERRGPDADTLERLYEACARAQRLYAKRLFSAEGEAARAYSYERGFTDETLRAFGLGWAPAQGNPLIDAARRSDFPLDVLEGAGLVRRTDDGADGRGGRPYDFFRGRLLIPIGDVLGRTVGFGGRILPGDDRPGGKYVNTPETALFRKSTLVYGLDRARPEVRRTRHIVLMEGYTDVMAAHQAGFTQAAAVLGTATTVEHAQRVRQTGARRVTLVFDGDAAGRKASLGALGGLLPLDFELDVLPLPPGKDPADLLLEEGAEGFRARLEGATPWFEHVVAGLAGLDEAELALAVDEVLELVNLLEKPVERDARTASLARSLELPEEAVRQAAKVLRDRRARVEGREALRRERSAPADPLQKGGVGDAGGTRSEETEALLDVLGSLLGAVLLDNSLLSAVRPHLDPGPLAELPEGAGGPLAAHLGEVSRVILELDDGPDEEAPIDAGAVLSALGDHPARDLVVPLAERAGTAESPRALVQGSLAWLERRRADLAIRRHRSTLHDPDRSLTHDPLTDDRALESLRTLHAELRRRKVPSTKH